MAKGGGNQGGGKGGKGGGGGKQTARSRNYLRQYGYPSSKELRREAQGLARGSVSSVHEVNRPFNRQAQSARDFLTAVQSALAETQGTVNTAYDTAGANQAALDQATQSRLAGLGLGVDAAGTQAALGARSDSAAAQLGINAAAAKSFAAAQPGIAAGATGVDLAGIRKNQTDALAARRDQLRQSFFAALQNVQSNALARAGFNQSADQFQQNMAFQQQQAATQASQYATSRADQNKQFAETMLAQNGFDVKTGTFVKSPGTGNSTQSLAKKYGLTANEVISLQGHTTTQVEQLLAQGYTFKKAIARAEANGVPPEIAKMSVYSIYSNPPPPPGAPNPNGFTGGASSPKYKAAVADYRSHLKAYQSAINGWQNFLQSKAFRKFYRQLGITLGGVRRGQSPGEGQLGLASSTPGGGGGGGGGGQTYYNPYQGTAPPR